MTIREAVKEAFDKMPVEFSIIKFIDLVRIIRKSPYLTDGSITRRLRELRSDESINYKVVNTQKAKYQKIINEEQLKIQFNG